MKSNPNPRIATLVSVFAAVRQAAAAGVDARELWDHLEFTGECASRQAEQLIRLLGVLKESELLGHAAVDIDGAAVAPEDLNQELMDQVNESWRLSLSKNALSEAVLEAGDPYVVAFATDVGYEAWLARVSPFEDQGPTRFRDALLVLSPVGAAAFGGARLAVAAFDLEGIPSGWPLPAELPSDAKIKSQLHNLLADSVSFDPNIFDLSWGDLEAASSEPWRLLAAKSLSACLVQDYAGNRVTLRGVRRLELDFSDAADRAPTANQLAELRRAVRWVYEERVETRAKLLADRLSLELQNASSYVAQVAIAVPEALRQAREQYGFVILERADQHAKEVRDLLKDVRSQADLYAEKTRSILGSLLRDTLAALFLLTLTIMSRAGRNLDAIFAPEVAMMFNLVGVYLIASAFLQGVVHGRDVYLSRKEIDYWSSVSRRYMNSEEIRKHINENIGPRETSFFALGVWLATIYVLLSVLCFRYDDFLRMAGFIYKSS